MAKLSLNYIYIQQLEDELEILIVKYLAKEKNKYTFW